MYHIRTEENNVYSVSMNELEEFRRLAEDTDKIAMDELVKTTPVLTTRSYLRMCRIVYDAVLDWDYPDDTPTENLFCEARIWSLRHEKEEGILGIDWDSPEEFAVQFMRSYHNEEIIYGGPRLYIHEEKKGWTGMVLICKLN